MTNYYAFRISKRCHTSLAFLRVSHFVIPNLFRDLGVNLIQEEPGHAASERRTTLSRVGSMIRNGQRRTALKSKMLKQVHDGLWCFYFRIFNLQLGTDILLLPARNHQPRTSSFVHATWNKQLVTAPHEGPRAALHSAQRHLASVQRFYCLQMLSEEWFLMLLILNPRLSGGTACGGECGL